MKPIIKKSSVMATMEEEEKQATQEGNGRCTISKAVTTCKHDD